MDSNGMFEMGCRFTIFCSHRPAVAFKHHILASHIDHRFNGNTHAIFNQRPRTSSAVIGHFGGFVHVASNAVTHQLAYNRIAMRFAVTLYCPSNISYPIIFARLFNSFIKRSLVTLSSSFIFSSTSPTQNV